jgi:hypothetical protein
MAPALAAKYPEIKTYSGRGIDDPAATLPFDVSPSGLHGQVLSPTGAYYVEPLSQADSSQYLSQYARDRSLEVGVECDEIGGPWLDTVGHGLLDGQSISPSSPVPVLNASPSGTQLRTYRMAVAATGEFTAANGGTVASSLATITTIVNWVNGIFENELSIRFELVANTDQLIYTNAATDPYTNSSNSTMLNENQANVNAVIGDSNYDIGHVFGTAGGGVAYLGIVGVSGWKAKGVSGSSTGFTTAHEIGHQFNADHTWNGDDFSSDQWSSTSAMEPGSGTTIMSYGHAGGNDNIQGYPDPYFHSRSLEQIVVYVDASIPTVGTRAATGNTIPTVSAGPDFTIPAQTPFILSATGSDGDGDVLTCSWEQRDVGVQRDLNAADDGISPLFRVWNPTTDPTRTFPRLADLLNNTTPKGEQLPTLSRAMKFRVTARDNRSGGGGINDDDMVVNVVNTGAAFVVTSPNTAVTFPGVSTPTFTWNVAGTTANGINTPNVNILLSTDGGSSFPTVLASGVPNDGSQDVVMPGVNMDSARIKIEGDGNIFFDVSDINFTIGTGATFVCSDFENFDGVTAPNLPAGWTTASTTGNVWTTVSGGSHTAPNHAFVPNIGGPDATHDLISPSVAITTASKLRFRHFHQFEAPDYDGGVLEISIDGGAFTDIIAAGGAFESGGYNGTLEVYNPLGGRAAWVGSSGGYIETVVSLPGAAIGNDVQLRWRMANDELYGAPGWQLDTIELCSVPAPEFDYGDAPDPSYPTLAASNGAAHGVGGPLFLGPAIDADADGQPNATATGDDTDGNNDEDGVTLPATITAGTNASVTVNASVALGLLNAWSISTTTATGLIRANRSSQTNHSAPAGTI